MWNKVENGLPELHQPVVCINVDHYENTGGDWDRNVQDCVYLSELHGRKYWSKCGERAISLDYYTHWMPLPAQPQHNHQHNNDANPSEICPQCGGSGKVTPKCSKCNGTGFVAECVDGVYSLKDCPNGCPQPVVKLHHC